jgi:hypothetical protein
MIDLRTLRSRYQVEGDSLFTERRVELVAVAATLLCLLQLAYGALRLGFLSEPDPILPVLEVGGQGGAADVEVVDAALSGEITGRPLFWETRRPLAAAPVAEEVAEEKPEDAGELDKVQLVGIFGAGESAGIITLVEGKKRRILVGETLEGWTLDRVESDRAVLKNKGRSRELVLKPPRGQGRQGQGVTPAGS